MRLIAAKCPQCQADVKINLEAKKAYCTYCGANLILDDEVDHIQFDNMQEAGFDFERGRQQAEDYINLELAQKLRNELYDINLIQELQAEQERKDCELRELQNDTEAAIFYSNSMRFKLPVWIGFVIPLVLTLIALFAQNIIWLYISLLTAFVWICFVCVNSKKYGNLLLAIDDMQYQSEAIAEELSQIETQLSVLDKSASSVPSKYRNVDAIEFFIDVLESGRALNLRECILVYEQAILDAERFELQQEQLELQREQLKLQMQTNDELRRNTKAAENTSRKADNAVSAASVAGALSIAAIATSIFLGGKRK